MDLTKLGIFISLIVVLASSDGFAKDKETLDEPDLFTLSIDVGRMGVMLDQGRRGLDLVLKEGLHDTEDVEDALTVKSLYADLARAIMAYNALLIDACGQNKVSSELCEDYYVPSWLEVPKSGDIPKKSDVKKLQQRIWEVQEKVGRLTGELCAIGQNIAKDETFCAIE